MSRVSLLLATLLLMLPACTGFREVGSGVYRSGQAGEDRLARRIEQNEIRTVVCLRGENGTTAASARAALGTGAAWWNVPFSATRTPSPETLLELWRVAEHAPRPMLIHCRAGVDRTGLASALVVLHDTGDLARARAQLSFLPHGHLAAFGTEKMDEVFDRYAPHHGTMSFPDWVTNVYAPTVRPAAVSASR
jgi:protein tyrosine/serine phosphatase